MTVALTEGDTTVIADGVTVGDTVVTDGPDKLQTGYHIEPRAVTPATGTGNGPGARRNAETGTGPAATGSGAPISGAGGNSGS